MISQVTVDYSKSYEEMSVEELQQCVLDKLAKERSSDRSNEA